MENSSTSRPSTIIIKSQKSVGLALVLTFLFGPLGMLYSTILGAVIMLVITGLVGLFTFGLGLFITWPICIIWGAMAASNSNKKIYL
jgi:hypothetical protein